MRPTALLLAWCALGAAATPRPVRAATIEVTIAHFTFTPARVEAHPGDTLLFINRDIVAHTATAADGSWSTGELAHNATARVPVPNGPGGPFICGFHPDMSGQLVILPPH